MVVFFFFPNENSFLSVCFNWGSGQSTAVLEQTPAQWSSTPPPGAEQTHQLQVPLNVCLEVFVDEVPK